jgi:hypothetical protein
MLYGAPEVPRQEKEPVQRVAHSSQVHKNGFVRLRSKPYKKNNEKYLVSNTEIIKKKQQKNENITQSKAC